MDKWLHLLKCVGGNYLSTLTAFASRDSSSCWMNILFEILFFIVILAFSKQLSVWTVTIRWVWLSDDFQCKQCAMFNHAMNFSEISDVFSQLTLKHRETHGCIVSTVATDALVLKAPGHQYPQCWPNIHCVGPVSYRKNIAHKVNSIRKGKTFWKKMTQSLKG